jgi:hypothetical protein
MSLQSHIGLLYLVSLNLLSLFRPSFSFLHFHIKLRDIGCPSETKKKQENLSMLSIKRSMSI